MSRRLPADLPRVLSTHDATERYSYSRDAIAHAIASGRWRRVTRGVLLTRDEPPTRDDWVTAALILAGPHAALSGWDAVRLDGLGARTPPTARVLVLDRRGANRRSSGLHIRPTRRPYRSTMLPSDHPTLPFVPVVHPARAVADTALLHSTLDPVRALITSSIQRRVCRPEDLLAEFANVPRQGSRWLRLALQDIATGAKSIAEAEAVGLLTRARVPTFEVNVAIVDRFGTLVAEADALWRELRMIVEIDSREFHLSEHDRKRTDRRHTFLTRHGLAVEHHAPSDIRSVGAAWATGVAEGLRARAAELGVPYVRGHGPRPVPPGGHPPLVLATRPPPRDQQRAGRLRARRTLC